MKTIFSLILALLFSISVNAQNSVVKNLQNKFKSINTLSADFSQVSKMSSDKAKPLATKGKIYYQKDDKYRIEFKSFDLISDGNTYWNYNKKANKVVINNLKDEPSSFSLKTILIDYPANSNIEFLGQESVNGEKMNLTRLTPKKSGSNFKSIKIWSDNNDLIRKVELTDNNDLTHTFEFSNIKVNQPIASDKFNFEAPKGSEVVDLR